MNTAKRKQIEAINVTLEKIIGACEHRRDMVEELKNDEQEKFDNMTESLQVNERGQKIAAAADMLGEAYDELDNAINSIESALSSLTTAVK